MKKMRKLSWLFLAGLMAVLTFTACSNADDDDPIDGGGAVTAPAGSGTEADPYNVLAAIQNNDPDKESTKAPVAWVKGYIVGQFKNYKTSDEGVLQLAPPFTSDNGEGVSYTQGNNILIAANKGETDKSKMVVVKIYDEFRTALNLVSNQGNLGAEVLLKATLKYSYGMPGMSDLTAGKLNGKDIEGGTSGTPAGDGTLNKPYNVSGAVAQNNSAAFAWVDGYIVGQIAGSKLDQAEFSAPFHGATNTDGTIAEAGTNLLLADNANETNASNCLIVQLPVNDLRTVLELVGHPSNDGKKLQVYGKLEKYFGVAGLKSCSAAIFEDKTIGTIPEDPTGAIFSETFASSLGSFTTYNVSGDQVWAWKSNYGATVSGFTTKSNANEDWLISPAIDLTGKSSAKLSFDHAINKGDIKNIMTNHTLWFSTNYSSGAPSTATWEQVTITTYPAGTDWNFVSSGAIVLPSKFQTANVRIAFKYLCSDAESATWEIKNFLIK